MSMNIFFSRNKKDTSKSESKLREMKIRDGVGGRRIFMCTLYSTLYVCALCVDVNVSVSVCECSEWIIACEP